MAAKQVDGRTLVAQNRRARHEYEILGTYEAGIVLVGSEVKSFREGKVQLRDSFARAQDGEVWLHGMHVPCQVVVTKSDKLGAAERGLLRERLRAEASALGASVALVSGHTGEGVAALWSRILHALRTAKDDGEPASG